MKTTKEQLGAAIDELFEVKRWHDVTQCQMTEELRTGIEGHLANALASLFCDHEDAILETLIRCYNGTLDSEGPALPEGASGFEWRS